MSSHKVAHYKPISLTYICTNIFFCSICTFNVHFMSFLHCRVDRVIHRKYFSSAIIPFWPLNRNQLSGFAKIFLIQTVVWPLIQRIAHLCTVSNSAAIYTPKMTENPDRGFGKFVPCAKLGSSRSKVWVSYFNINNGRKTNLTLRSHITSLTLNTLPPKSKSVVLKTFGTKHYLLWLCRGARLAVGLRNCLTWTVFGI